MPGGLPAVTSDFRKYMAASSAQHVTNVLELVTLGGSAPEGQALNTRSGQDVTVE